MRLLLWLCTALMLAWVTIAQTLLNERIIRSPLSGIVVKKYRETGEAVDRVDKIFGVVNIDKVYV